MTTPVLEFIGVYDADATLWGEVSHWVGARLGRRHCSLCDITHGLFTRRRAWTACAEELPVEFVAFHRNDAPDDAITSIIHPLGLQPNRLRAVRSISRDFLATEWADPTAFYGCGKFVADSWRIFCQGDVSGAGGRAGGFFGLWGCVRVCQG